MSFNSASLNQLKDNLGKLRKKEKNNIRLAQSINLLLNSIGSDLEMSADDKTLLGHVMNSLTSTFKKGKVVNFRVGEHTFLYRAVNSHNSELVRFLLFNKAEVDSETHKQVNSPLFKEKHSNISQIVSEYYGNRASCFLSWCCCFPYCKERKQQKEDMQSLLRFQHTSSHH